MTQKRIFAKIFIFFKKVLDKFRLSWYNNLVECGGIAQLARALGSYPGCHWFESDCRYHTAKQFVIRTALIIGPLVKRLRHRPFTAESWVQFPYGSPHHRLLNGFVKLFGSFLFYGKIRLSNACPMLLNHDRITLCRRLLFTSDLGAEHLSRCFFAFA